MVCMFILKLHYLGLFFILGIFLLFLSYNICMSDIEFMDLVVRYRFIEDIYGRVRSDLGRCPLCEVCFGECGVEYSNGAYLDAGRELGLDINFCKKVVYASDYYICRLYDSEFSDIRSKILGNI